MNIARSILDLMSAALNGVLRQYPAALVDIAKIEGLRYYLKGILAAREFLIFTGQLGFLLILILMGFLMLHAGAILILFLIISWSLAVKLTLVFLVAFIELITALICLRVLFSDKKWIKFSKADLLTARLLK